ncbi:MAG: selenide,water dikinase [Bacillariaceae sp.]
MGTADGRIALDCSIRETRQGHYVISTTDFFFPLVDSPYLQGRIGAANVLSDLYAEGVQHCDFVLMLLAASLDMTPQDRTICTNLMVRGFRDACTEAETTITGGQTVLNPWAIIGGVATSVVTRDEYVSSDGACVGDVIVLTKPIGTQIAVNVHEWRKRHEKKAKNGDTTGDKHWNKILEQNKNGDEFLTVSEAEIMMHAAVRSMSKLNRFGSKLMTKHNAHAGTDVTGFGLLGHAQNLMDNQIAEVGIELHTLPCIANTLKINDNIMNFRLRDGYSAETSGGLMISMTEADAIAYCAELREVETVAYNYNTSSAAGTDFGPWIIGRVVESADRKATITEDAVYLEV